MNPIQIYGVAAGSILGLLLLCQTSSIISKWIQKRTLFYILKYVIYPVFLKRRSLLGPVGRWHILLIFFYAAGTAVCNVLGVVSLPEAGIRAGSISIFHLIPLLLSDRLALAADLLGLRPQSLRKCHTSIGLMAIVQAIIHVAIHLINNPINFRDQSPLYGLISVVFLCTLLLSAILRRFQYEFFTKLHLLLAISLIYTLWRHLPLSPVFLRVYVIVAGTSFLITTLFRLSCMVFRNIVLGRKQTKASVDQINDAIRIHVEVARPWEVKAGEYIYIWVPRISFWSVFQSHPFMVAWWDQNFDGKSCSIHLLVKPQDGFTRKLVRHSGSSGLRAWIDGPYGRPQSFSGYGNVMMFASGVGIAAQVPHIKEILRKYKECRACTKTVLLIWQLDKESDQNWVRDWMDILLTEDEGLYILRIRLYVLRQFENQGASYGDQEQYGSHERIRKLYGKPDIQKLIETEINDKRGRLMITTATNGKLRDRIGKAVCEYMVEDVKLVHLDFQPREKRWWFSARPTEVKYQGVV